MQAFGCNFRTFASAKCTIYLDAKYEVRTKSATLLALRSRLDTVGIEPSALRLLVKRATIALSAPRSAQCPSLEYVFILCSTPKMATLAAKKEMHGIIEKRFF